MKILQEYPPNYDKIKSVFDLDGLSVVFCYDDTIYNPQKLELPNHLIEHERIHHTQQMKTSPSYWWDRYLNDSPFRLEQELEAYAVQYGVIHDMWYNYKTKDAFLDELALQLSSKMYGNIISFAEAKSKIRNVWQQKKKNS